MQPNQSVVDLASVSFTLRCEFSPPYHVKNLFYLVCLVYPVEPRSVSGSFKPNNQETTARPCK